MKSKAPPSPVDWVQLYEHHPDYVARRAATSFERAQIELEVSRFKLPNLLALLRGEIPRTVVEIGCATGELIGGFPTVAGGRRVGVDLSEGNVAAARERFPDVEFFAGDFRRFAVGEFDVVVLSDVLEHVPDDVTFLRDASRLARRVLINFPLECNWLNLLRDYGPRDTSGHLRAYTAASAIELMKRAGLDVSSWSRVWFHEVEAELARRDLRSRFQGQAYSGGIATRLLKRAVYGIGHMLPPLGRRLFVSNLFALARVR